MIELLQKLRTQMRWIMGIIALAFLLSTFFMYESRSGGDRRVSPDGRLMDYVVAEINGVNLMRSELDQVAATYAENYKDLTSADLPSIYQVALNQIILEKQINQEIKDKGIKISEEDIKAAINQYADMYFPTREAFFEAVKRSGQKLSDFERDFEYRLARESLIKSAIGNIAVGEDEAMKYYNKIKDFRFKRSAGVKLDIANFRTKDAAEKVRSLLVAGKSWSQATSDDVLASKDLIGKSGKEPMLVPLTMLEGQFEALKNLKLEEVSPVLEVASDDWLVAVKRELVEERIMPYTEVSGDVRRLYEEEKKIEAQELFAQSLLAKANVEILDKLLFAAEPAEKDLPLTAETSQDQTASETLSKDVLKSGDKN